VPDVLLVQLDEAAGAGREGHGALCLPEDVVTLMGRDMPKAYARQGMKSRTGWRKLARLLLANARQRH
jgi:hypothetical protein